MEKKNQKQPFYELLDGHKTIDTGIKMVEAFIKENPRPSDGLAVFDPKFQETMIVISCETKEIPAVCRLLSAATGNPVIKFGHIGLQDRYVAEINNTSVIKPGYYSFINNELLFNENRTRCSRSGRAKQVAIVVSLAMDNINFPQ